MKNSAGMSKKTIFSIILFGLFGQIAWCIENMFLNLYVFRTITTKLSVVSAMVASSAVVATLTSIVMGWYTDRVGKRRPFMTYGYMIWGVSVMVFALFSIKNMQNIFGVDRDTAILLACVGMVVTDCVMTFFGSTANDAAFNAWVTDNTNKTNRGKIEALLSVMTIVAYMLVVIPFETLGVTSTKYYDANGTRITAPVSGGTTVLGNWTLFYCLLGGLMILAGFAGLFFIKDVPELKPKKNLAFKDLFYGFRPSVIKRNKYLYLVLTTLAISSIATNCYSNYLTIYLQNTLRCDEYITFLNPGYILPMGVIYGLSAAAGIAAGFMLDKKKKKTNFLIPGIIASSGGAVMMYFFSPDFMPVGIPMLILFCVGAFIQAIGTSIISVVCLATVRNLTPPDKVGRFQGVRMVFAVMLPMCIGSIVSGVISSSDRFITGYDDFGHAVYTCPPIMFLLTAAIAVFCIITAVPLMKTKSENLLIPAEGVTEEAKTSENAPTSSPEA
jgi:MFS family permease